MNYYCREVLEKFVNFSVTRPETSLLLTYAIGRSLRQPLLRLALLYLLVHTCMPRSKERRVGPRKTKS